MKSQAGFLEEKIFNSTVQIPQKDGDQSISVIDNDDAMASFNYNNGNFATQPSNPLMNENKLDSSFRTSAKHTQGQFVKPGQNPIINQQYSTKGRP